VSLLQPTYQLKPYALKRETTPGQEEYRITSMEHKQQMKAITRFTLGRNLIFTVTSSS
jgi:hypothetical protein